MTKYNLMEDTYGDNWAKTPADKYLDSSFCTIGILILEPINDDIRYVKLWYYKSPIKLKLILVHYGF